MQLTTQRLKQIIKEELEAIVSELEPEEEVLSPEEERVASLEQQLAEAKKKVEMKGKEKKGGTKAAMKGKSAPVGKRGTVAPAAAPMKANNVGNLYGKGPTKMPTKKWNKLNLNWGFWIWGGVFTYITSIYIWKEILFMNINENKVRQIIKEELKQYLIEEGFFDTIKSFGKKVFGGEKKETPSSLNGSDPERMGTKGRDETDRPNPEQGQSVRTKYANDVQSYKYGFPIKALPDLEKALTYYRTLSKRNEAGAVEAVAKIMTHLQRSLAKKKSLNDLATGEIQSYQTFIKDIEDHLTQEQEPIYVNENLFSDKSIDTALVIPNNIVSKVLVQLQDFIFDELSDKYDFNEIFKKERVRQEFQALKNVVSSSAPKKQQQKNSASVSDPVEKFTDTYLEEIRRKRAKWIKMI